MVWMLPMDSAAWETKLNQLIAESRHSWSRPNAYGPRLYAGNASYWDALRVAFNPPPPHPWYGFGPLPSFSTSYLRIGNVSVVE